MRPAKLARLKLLAATRAARTLGPPPNYLLRGGSHVAKTARGTRSAKKSVGIRESVE